MLISWFVRILVHTMLTLQGLNCLQSASTPQPWVPKLHFAEQRRPSRCPTMTTTNSTSVASRPQAGLVARYPGSGGARSGGPAAVLRCLQAADVAEYDAADQVGKGA